MTLPASGAIRFNNVNVELGLSGTAQINLNGAAVRTLFGVPSGAIAMSNGYGKANEFSFSITSNQTNANLRTLAINAGWNQSSAVVATINGGVFVSSSSVGTPALTVDGSFPAGVKLVNNGAIQGMGGNGGTGASLGSASGGASGGLALSVSSAITIDNTSGVVAGGGGGGGGGGSAYLAADESFSGLAFCGGGGGGGRTGTSNSGGGSGGTRPGANGTSGSPGGTGTSSSAGGGGGGGSGDYSEANYTGGSGGAGGDRGSSGTGGNAAANSPSLFGSQAGAGAGGGAVSGNGNITWLANGARYGSIG
jgi:hypothetical protein